MTRALLFFYHPGRSICQWSIRRLLFFAKKTNVMREEQLITARMERTRYLDLGPSRAPEEHGCMTAFREGGVNMGAQYEKKKCPSLYFFNFWGHNIGILVHFWALLNGKLQLLHCHIIIYKKTPISGILSCEF